jgi:hypothetical protein
VGRKAAEGGPVLGVATLSEDCERFDDVPVDVVQGAGGQGGAMPVLAHWLRISTARCNARSVAVNSRAGAAMAELRGRAMTHLPHSGQVPLRPFRIG